MPTLSGYGLHSKIKLASRDGNFYQAWLWKLSYSGSTAALRASGDSPLLVTWGRGGSDPFVPVMASHAEVNGVRLDSEYDALVGADTDEWRLEIQRGASHSAIDSDSGTRVWLGRILGDVYEDSTMGTPHVLNLQAVDGLGALKEIPYYDTDTSPERLAYTGREALLTILIRALGKLGYSLPIRSAIAWRPTTVSGAEDTLAEVDADNLAFYSPNGSALSCYDVVEGIARRLGARLFQWEGAWWIISRELLTGSTYTYFKYASDGTADGTDTAGTPIDTGAVDAEGKLIATRTAGTRSFRPPASSVAVVQNHGPIPPIIDEGDFTIDAEAGRYKKYGRYWCTVRPDFSEGSWSYTGNAQAREAEPSIVIKKYVKYSNLSYVEPTVIQSAAGAIYQNTTPVAERNFVHAVPAYFASTSSKDPTSVRADVASGNLSTAGPHYAERTSASVEAGTKVQFSAKVRIEKNEGRGDGLFTPYWSLQIVGTNYYLRGTGSWDQSTSPTDIVQEFWAPAIDMKLGEYGITLDSEQSQAIVSAAMPVAGQLRLRLYGTADKLSSDLDPGDTLWDDVAVLVVDESGEVLGAERTDVFVVGSSEPAREDVEVILGEGGGVIFPPVLTDAGTKTSDWTSARIASASSLSRIHAETILRHALSPVEMRRESYLGLSPSMTAPLQIGSGYYPVQELTIDYHHQEASGEWTILQWDGATSVSAETESADPAGTISSRVGGSSSSGTSASAESLPGGQSIRKNVATVTGTGGAGNTVTITPPLLGDGLTPDDIQLVVHYNANVTNWGLTNVTATTFDIHAVTSDGSDVTFTWWVIDDGAGISALYGEWHFDEARNSHHILTAGF